YKMNDQTLVDTMVRDALWDVFNDCHMITTADNICREWHLTREELDAFALRSQKRAIHAIKTGKFVKEIVPVTVQRKKESFLFQTDEGPRESTMEGLSALKPVFPDGFVTAGNASGINDGAAAVVVMSEDYAKDLRIRPMATFVTSALAGVRPDIMGIGPVASTEKLLDRTGFKISDFDVIEANEAFAAQSIAVAKELHIDTERQLNPNGGAIALGHPVGASGCRILVTLLHEMQERDLHLGLATLCIGGGMGCSTIVRRERT
ncbi:MAG: acetyl-CoA C-acyltransferase, partial [Parasporobacterium sp.]|nr:acetyl-CoA C-acyltransferase [Parasporobacterium sp.]